MKRSGSLRSSLKSTWGMSTSVAAASIRRSAQALNNVRDYFYHEGAWDRAVGLNVASSFELYGLG